MQIVITHLELKTIGKFFPFSKAAMHIWKDLQKSPALVKKKRGFWRKHYTLSAWNTVEDYRNFGRSENHLQAMKDSGKYAKQIIIYKMEAAEIPDWKTAIQLLHEKGKVYTY